MRRTLQYVAMTRDERNAADGGIAGSHLHISYYCSNEGQTLKFELLIFQRKEVIRFIFTYTVVERRKRGIYFIAIPQSVI